MAESLYRRPSERSKVIGCVSWGNAPTEIRHEDNTKAIFFDIHNFADQEHKRGEFLLTKSIEVHGHSWRLKVCPRGYEESNVGAEYVTIGLVYSGLTMACAKVMIITKSKEEEFPTFRKFNVFSRILDYRNYSRRNDIVRNDLTEDGTLTIRVEITMAAENPARIWFPTLRNPYNNIIEKRVYPTDRDAFEITCNKDIGMNLYRSIGKNYDVTFFVGPSRKEIHAHKAVLAVKAKDLYELIETEEESASLSSIKDTSIVLSDINADAFDMLIRFCYTERVPASYIGEANKNDNAAHAKTLLVVANRFGCTSLKLVMESLILHEILAPSNAARLLLLADSYSCPMLKEASMNMYIADSKTVKESENDWNNLQESNKLLVELLDYSTSDRKVYSSVVLNGDGTTNDADGFDVSSLRERLEKYDLDVDGSQEILLKRWKDHLLFHISSVDG